MGSVPLALVAFVAGDLLLQQFPVLPTDAALLAVGAVALALFAPCCCSPASVRAKRAAALLACAAACLGGFAYAGAVAQWRLADALAFADEGRDIRVVGVVASLPTAFDGGTRFLAQIDGVVSASAESPAFAVPRRIALSWYEAGRVVLPAQRWQWTVRLHRPHAPVNPAGFDAEAWMLEQGIRAQGTVRSGTHDAAPVLRDSWVWQFNPLVDRARAALRDRLQALLQGRRNGSVLIALVIGDQSAIGEDDWALFNRTGISHLVSISGLHITMIAAFAALLAGLVWRRSARLLRLATVPVVRALAAIGGGLAYCLLAGWGVPAQRTLLMLGVVALGQCWRARLNSAAVLAAAAALVCVWDPWAVLAAGFWLSFGAVACIFLATSGGVAPEPGWRAAAREGVRIQAVITIGQVPLTLAIFGQLSLVAPLANAVAIPLVSYLVAPLALGGAAFAACGDAGSGIAHALLLAADVLFGVLTAFLHWLTTPAWSSIALAAPPLWAFAIAAAGCAWLLAPAGWPLRVIGLCGLLPLFVWPVDRPGAGELWVSALDVGQGMAVVLETAQAVVVFDTGPRYSADADAGSRIIVPYLRARGLRRVDVLIVSHPDIDHAGGALSVLRALPATRIWTSIAPDHRLLGGAQPVTRCEAGQRLALGDLLLEVLHPTPDLYRQPRATTNARSCVVMASVGRHRVLLTGDVPARQEQQILERAAGNQNSLAAELLIAPHHGSHSSSSAAFIAAAAPRWVSMQLGYRNHFGHPHAEVVQRYRERGVAIERSDEQGAVQWRFDETGTTLVHWRRDHARYWFNQPLDSSAAAAVSDPVAVSATVPAAMPAPHPSHCADRAPPIARGISNE